MRAKKIFLLIPLLFMAVSAVFAMPQNDIVSDVMQKDAALGQHQRSVRDSIGALVRREMMTHVGESRSQVDSVSGMRLQVSLLTCGPGPEIYEYYGHSAIRVLRTDTVDFDLVFNYGVFDFNSGNFALRFALGHTDYICAMQQTVDFVEAYRRKGIYIDEQVLNVTQAEANRLAVTAEKVQQAKALQDAYIAERDAENARAERERSTQQANILVAQQVEKDRIIIAAEAEAEKLRVSAKGEADAIFAKMEAEAKGYYEILTKQAAGYDKMVQAAGGDAAKAFMLLMSEKMPELVKTQVEAIKGIKFDNVTVWDSGNGADGKGSTANFLSGLLKSVPPMSDLFNMAGLNLPEYLAKKQAAETAQAEEIKDDKK